ncbi:MAG: HAD family phosphatase [Betaproteobacteria bacterium]|nr:MAG: HAD family phosphatase [Betaproteobacteria bacterium]
MERLLPSDVDALLFDLGGVILEIDFTRAFAAWASAAGVAADAIATRFAFDSAYAAHERGEIGAVEYFASLRHSLELELSDEQFAAGWNTVIVGEIPGMRALLAAAARARPLHLFSNTGEVHRRHWETRYREVLQPFARRFLSCEIGLRKPDPEAFAWVARRVGLAPQRIAFFDDTAANVAGARTAGLRAFHVRSPAEVAAALQLSS